MKEPKIDLFNLQTKRYYRLVTISDFSMLAPANNRRVWCTVNNVSSSAGKLYVILWNSQPDPLVPNYPVYAVLDPGGSAGVSTLGDYPWQGAIWGLAVGGTASSFTCECSEYPYGVNL